MGLRAALVDMGGVVLDMLNTRGIPEGALDWRGREALLKRLRRRGARLDPEELDDLLFAPWRREYERRYDTGREASWEPHLERLARRVGGDPDPEVLPTWFRPYGERLRPRPGAGEALRRLRRLGLRLALVSNVPLPGRLYESVLERHGLAGVFEIRLFSYEAGSRKPSPAMPRRALRALGAAPAEALMVGDRRRSDVAAGRAAGLLTIWVRSADGGGPAADHEIGNLAELPALVRELVGAAGTAGEKA